MYSARPAILTTFLLLIAGCFTTLCDAQAIATASRAAQFSVFGGFSPTYTDFGHHTYNGYMFGADAGVFPPRWWLSPSIEFRYTHATNTPVTEHAYLIGPKIHKDIGRFRPYAEFLAGVGGINYHPVIVPGDVNDGGRDFAYGGGIDLYVAHNTFLKVDFLQQQWNLGKDGNFQNVGDYTLSPWSGTVGVVYDFSYSNLHKQRELR